MTHMTDAHTVSPSDTGADLAVFVARTASDMKASSVLVLDVGAVLSIAGYFVIASASNPRQVRAVVDDIEAKVKAEFGRSPVRTEGIREQQWSLIDYGDVVVHVFLESVREFYEIERLYMDAPRLEWEPPAVATATS